METNAKLQFKVGVFLLLGVATAMISIFMIGGDKSFFTGHFRVHARFDQVQGLAEGSVVSLSGIVVGNIERIDFIPEDNQVDVTMTVEKRYAPRFTRDAQVEIRTQGALGDKFIFIIPGDPKAPLLEDGGVLQIAKASDLFGIIAERGKETEKIFDIIDELHKTAKTINADGRLEKIMTDLTVTTGQLRRTVAQTSHFTQGLADADPAKVKRSIDSLDRIMTKIDRGEGTLGALINDPTLHERLKSILGGSSRPQHIKSMLRTSVEKSEAQ